MKLLDSFVSNNTTKQVLESLLTSSKIGHAYLFSGSTSIGKITLARIFASSQLNCDIEKLEQHPDFHTIRRDYDEKKKAEKQYISVEQIRNLRITLSQSSMQGNGHIVIIQNADLMTPSAQNALLKTLEEPKEGTIIILTTNSPEKVFDTLHSRCMDISLPIVEREIVCKALRDKGIGKEKAHELAGISMGRPGKAFELMDVEKYDDLQESIGEALNFFEVSLPERFKITESITKSEKDRRKLLQKISYYELVLHDLLLLQNGVIDKLALIRQKERLDGILNKNQNKNWTEVLHTMEEIKRTIQENGNIGLSLEHLALAI